MDYNDPSADTMPVVPDVEDFDRCSGNRLERLIFNNRALILLLCAAVSLFLGYQASTLRANASYEGMFPASHPYMRNYLDNRKDLGALGNTLRIAVENTQGDIYDPQYLEVLRQLTDKIMVTKGVDRGWVKSLWLPSVHWTDVTEAGYAGGAVMPDEFDGSPEKTEQLRRNIQRARIVGSLISPDFRSSMVVAPLFDTDPETLSPLDYHELSQVLDQEILSLQTAKVRIHIVGFAKLVGDLIAGLQQVMKFFAFAVLITALIVFAYTRCLHSTVLLVTASLLGVIWLLGLIALLGRPLNPYSVLVPFLIFAIGVSHGAQKMNGVMQDVARGTHRYVAARYTFRRLFLAGLTALLTNMFGFAVLMVVDIPVIREMALITSLGVAVLIFTKLILIPIMLSYIGVSKSAAVRRWNIEQRRKSGKGLPDLSVIARFTERKWAIGAIACAALLAGFGLYTSRSLQVGDLDPGAPELWPGSLYNRDVAFVNRNFGLSTDQFAVIVKTPSFGGQKYGPVLEMERLGWLLQQDPNVQGVDSLAERVPLMVMGQFEANPKWLTIPRSDNTGNAVQEVWSGSEGELVNADYTVMPVIAYLTDHKAATLSRLFATVEGFAKAHNADNLQFLPIAGSAGLAAVTNIVVEKAHREMLLLLYAAVAVLCLITFKSWRAVIVALIPLIITAVICEALMVKMGVGLKVATLPVHALGVGVGVDYALYLLSVQLAMQRKGASLREAYAIAVGFTGRVVALIGVTMAAGVITWAWSPIKFQADMGMLLAFMFIWNMIGALILIPALSYFLLRKYGVPRPTA
jgi:predicted RND superfamily exporter protein